MVYFEFVCRFLIQTLSHHPYISLLTYYYLYIHEYVLFDADYSYFDSGGRSMLDPGKPLSPYSTEKRVWVGCPMQMKLK